MKKYLFSIIIVISFVIEIFACLYMSNRPIRIKQDSIAVSDCIRVIQNNYSDTSKFSTDLEYVVLNKDGTIYYENGSNLSKTINEAIINNDTILDINIDDEIVGQIIIKNSIKKEVKNKINDITKVFVIFSCIQLSLVIIHIIYLNNSIIKPFKGLNDFASRVAGGNLDIPLGMDKNHIFGEFSEAFDIMRVELKKAKIAEKKANDEKKETIAKLSHDIKTPVASIKATAEMGYELASNDKEKEKFNLINVKTDQIRTLVDNLFNSSVNEITEIQVKPANYPSDVIVNLINNSDYLNKVSSLDIPKCNIFIDKLRLQQTFDNIFMNSYKYANTKIDVNACLKDEFLIIEIRDYGSGVLEDDLPLLKEKYKRGSNVTNSDGAGLGLFLTNYFMENINGKLELGNANPGFVVKLYIRTM